MTFHDSQKWLLIAELFDAAQESEKKDPCRFCPKTGFSMPCTCAHATTTWSVRTSVPERVDTHVLKVGVAKRTIS